MISIQDFLFNIFNIPSADAKNISIDFDVYSWYLTVFFAFVSIVSVVTVFFSLYKKTSNTRFSVIIILRVLIMSVLLLMIFRPIVVVEQYLDIREKLILLLDNSKSMSITSLDKKSRWDKNVDIIKSPVFTSLSKKYDLECYTFGENITKQPDLNSCLEAKPDEDSTDTLKALDYIIKEGMDLNATGLVLFSDGIDKGALGTSWKANGKAGIEPILKNISIPIYSFQTNNDEFSDISIKALKYNDFAFLKQSFTLQVTLGFQNINNIKSTVVNLYQNGKVLSAKKIEMDNKKNSPINVNFTITPDKIGKFTYTVDTPFFSTESVKENNKKSFTIKVIRDKMRVLQVAGAPSFDVRFLRHYLKSDSNIDLVSFFILRNVLDPTLYPSTDYSLIEFPYQNLFDRNKDLSSFDLVILQNFGYLSYFRGESLQLLTNLAEYVKHGGSLAMIGGEQSFSAGDYANTPIESILPVKLDVLPSIKYDKFKLKLTAQGSNHPVTSLFLDKNLNKSRWQELGSIDGLNLVSPNNNSVVLIESDDSYKYPILSIRNIDKGRTLALMTDNSWYWALEEAMKGNANQVYPRFWKNALRYLVGDPEDSPIQIETDKENYKIGDEVQIIVKVVNSTYEPSVNSKVKISLKKTDSALPSQQLVEATTDSFGQVVHNWKSQEGGTYKVSASANIAQGVSTSDSVFTIDSYSEEMVDLVPDQLLLSEISILTKGNAISLKDPIEDLLKKSNRASTSINRVVVNVWDNIIFYILLIVLFSLELLLRRKWNIT